ncbi:AAA family ATPase [Candidatus Venteria ishoeyi]|uniref:ORC1/DEAH AAA+ ATPase domain-containing protein n=1 Tax=Candidatus Venteria ishoeyi TaxID=1899563 RepID=A0A1H6FCE7_9GAMM|nr:AAA family ATPase [Candidatus Venteria ishoeyi]SEH07760.1 Uncharacterised protein [Candidatus Venteria ishoeyi]
MYYEYFGLNSPPFKITPDPQLFYRGEERGLMLDALVYAVGNGEGVVKVTGEVGSGKTMLCRMLPEKLPEQVEVLYLANPRLTPDTILQAIAMEMDLQFTNDVNHLQLMQRLHETLLQKHSEKKQVLLLVEEAQGMPLETLEEIRLLSNLETSQHKLLQIILFGQPELDDNLKHKSIRQLRERITHHFYLPPLLDIRGYLDFRMQIVGYRGPSVFSASALRTLKHYSLGLLRRVNILADKALLAAFSDNTHSVSKKHILLAAKDSGYQEQTLRGWQRMSLASMGFILLVGLAIFAANHWLPGKLFSMPWLPIGQSTLTPASITASTMASEPPINKWFQVGDQPLPVITIVTPEPSAPRLETPEHSRFFSFDQSLSLTNIDLPQKMRYSKNWKENPDKARYYIQLMRLNSDNPIVLRKALAQDNLQTLQNHLYLIKNKANIWLLIYAGFNNRKQAQAALHQLPNSLTVYKPFIRSIE